MGIFGNFFDFDGDGKASIFEELLGLELLVVRRVVHGKSQRHNCFFRWCISDDRVANSWMDTRYDSSSVRKQQK